MAGKELAWKKARGADYFFDKAREFHRMLELIARLAGKPPPQIGV